jgi:trans-2,3-dihydro-3-hydroxyanthranilate isomerase
MLAFARETNLSETTFVQSATAAGADYRNRIWMTTGELAFAGHPSLGTAVAVALARGDEEAGYVQQTIAGLQPCDVRLRDERHAYASMLQEPAEFGEELDVGEVLEAAGLDSRSAHPELPPQVVATGVPQVVAPVIGSLEGVRPDAARLATLLQRVGAVTLYLASGDLTGGSASARSFFIGVDGPREDPATGSAAGPLMAYAHERLGVERLDIDQGVLMGRPSRLECSWDGGRARVGGEVVLVASGTVHL